jgi:MscS family membrane protein
MNASANCVRAIGRVARVTLIALLSAGMWAQGVPFKPATTETQPEPPKDPLGRNTPRGAVLNFLSNIRKGHPEIAALYLNGPLTGELRDADPETLAQQLATVLDRGLPARLDQISDEPEDSVPDPLRPDEDVIGTISTSKGDLDVLVERVDRGKAGKVWLFSQKTLISIPEVFDELNTPTVEAILPKFLVVTGLAGIPLFEWLALFLGMPFLYLMTGLLSRLISFGVGACRRRLFRNGDIKKLQALPVPIRLLLVALSVHWLLSKVSLPLLARQFWSTTSLVIVIVACTWLLMLLIRKAELYLVARRPSLSGSAAVLRLIRRVTNGLLCLAALLFTLHHFGIDPTAALAGLGVGGIAVALAAQKTLENVIAGVSLIADQAVRVGDTLKLNDIVGTVEDVGLRSTRIRTLDRTLISVPNGQIANMSLETLSARDKFWFHPIMGLRYETTPIQLRSLIIGIRKLLAEHSSIDPSTVRVRFLRLSAFALDLEICAYVTAHDWDSFITIQEDLLLNVLNLVKETGTGIAFPSQTLYFAARLPDKVTRVVPEFTGDAGQSRTAANEECFTT